MTIVMVSAVRERGMFLQAGARHDLADAFARDLVKRGLAVEDGTAVPEPETVPEPRKARLRRGPLAACLEAQIQPDVPVRPSP